MLGYEYLKSLGPRPLHHALFTISMKHAVNHVLLTHQAESALAA